MNLNKDGTKNYYVLESYRTDTGKSATRIVRKLGTHDELLKEHADPEAWAQSVVEEMNRKAQGGQQQIATVCGRFAFTICRIPARASCIPMASA